MSKVSLIELLDYSIIINGAKEGINDLYFTLAPGDVCCIDADLQDNAHGFLKALATLIYPLEGIYRYNGEKLDFSDYRNLLSTKRKIGYIAYDAAMISNLTVRQNLLLERFFFENRLDIDLTETVKEMCDNFGLIDKLDVSPTQLSSIDLQMAISIRELTKSPEVILLDRPEDFIGHARFDRLFRFFQKMVKKGMTAVFNSYNTEFIDEFATRKIVIHGHGLTSVLP